MRLPESMVERAAAVLETPEYAAVELEDEARNVLFAALSPEAIRELATGPCIECGGTGEREGVPERDARGAEVVPVADCPACKGHGSLLAAWLAEDAVDDAVRACLERTADASDKEIAVRLEEDDWQMAVARDCLSAAAGALSERGDGGAAD